MKSYHNMKKVIIPLIFTLFFLSEAIAGTQQEYFLRKASLTSKVTIVQVGPDKTLSGSIRQHTLLSTMDRTLIDELIATLDMEDPQTELLDTGEEIRNLSIFIFGMPTFIMTFYQKDTVLLEYGFDDTISFLAPFGEHAHQECAYMQDYNLTAKSAEIFKAFINQLRRELVTPLKRHRR